MPTKQQKVAAVEKIKKALGKYPVVAVATLQNLPSRQYNAIKKKMRGKAEFVMARSTLLSRAISEAKPELKELAAKFDGSTALVLTELDPFALVKTLKQSRTKTAAKPGQIAPADLIAPAGETNLAPGPVLTELKQAGIQAKIKGPKVVIDKDAVLAKKGEAISENAAKILAKLGVEPIEVGLKITAAFEKGSLYPGSVLEIDEEAYLAQLALAHAQAVNLGVNAGVYNSTTMPLIIAKAEREARALSSVASAKMEKTPAEPEAAQAPETAASEAASQAPAEAPAQPQQ